MSVIMTRAPLLAAGDIMHHLTPQYLWQMPWGGAKHPVYVNLWDWNLAVESVTGINPGIHTHIVMMWFAALAVCAFFIPISRSFMLVPTGMRNFLEPVLLFIRDEMVYPNMGEKDGRTYLPYF